MAFSIVIERSCSNRDERRVVCIWNVEVFALVCSVTVSVNRDEDEFLASLAFSCSVTRTESD